MGKAVRILNAADQDVGIFNNFENHLVRLQGLMDRLGFRKRRNT